MRDFRTVPGDRGDWIPFQVERRHRRICVLEGHSGCGEENGQDGDR